MNLKFEKMNEAAYNPFPVFQETAEISCFLEKGEVGKGIGKEALVMLEEDGKIL